MLDFSIELNIVEFSYDIHANFKSENKDLKLPFMKKLSIDEANIYLFYDGVFEKTKKVDLSGQIANEVDYSIAWTPDDDD